MRKHDRNGTHQSGLNAIARASRCSRSSVRDGRADAPKQTGVSQSRRGLAADGIVGPITRAAMVKRTGPGQRIDRGARSPATPDLVHNRGVQSTGPGCNRAESESRDPFSAMKRPSAASRCAPTSAGVAAGGCSWRPRFGGFARQPAFRVRLLTSVQLRGPRVRWSLFLALKQLRRNAQAGCALSWRAKAT